MLADVSMGDVSMGDTTNTQIRPGWPDFTGDAFAYLPIPIQSLVFSLFRAGEASQASEGKGVE